MGPVVTARPPQTLYVTIRRDELRLLKEERDLLLDEVTQLRLQLQHAQLPYQGQALAR
ncbi:DUF6026 family protein [Pseudomonas sp. SAICEU22]|jgi:hypothetical protein|uniref:DUF6026 family protein n=2 Tax=Pseudomonas TaxID=286 RepID=A0ABT3FC50_9PSED|nr:MULTISPECIES: DUF6026 family protein [Pseudomonas]MBJ2347480.1 hypothetical protein [Pseudomonas canavaninivorans]MBL3543286.1 hypothetical protein [Pseudomonas sp. HB05]MCL6702328.1 DUF6026 family protein [Pseudomonas sp. T1.Ur]MCW1246369.1 DUF6026 family protein [Pseudomonas agronomica]QXI55877.1 hypothetical protein KSS97_13385 [Pseudomonas alvandae]